MRYLVFVSGLVLAAVVAAPAGAGGWASVGLASMPEGVSSGEPWNAEITVLRHGVTPTDWSRAEPDDPQFRDRDIGDFRGRSDG